MATGTPKTERRKLFTTEVIGTRIVWFNAETEEELARLDTKTLTPAMELSALTYGVIQVVADRMATATTAEEKIHRLCRNVAALGSGQWPTNSDPTKGQEATIAVLMDTLGLTRAAARAALKLPAE